jgi:beta-1,4-mannosyltransferase
MKRRYNYIVVQNPPCLPLLLVAVLIQLVTWGRTKLIIDWHNYGFSILRVNQANRAIVWIAKVYEVYVGKFAWKHLTVSEAMKRDL